ncbi:hypothetical protein [Roseivivax sediminis]|uniref:hypothetical protein n=1 Tax=Roseivivax sediminis TaxID=936889 RepID=UPI00165F8010|nr:hypothetical protein [Roseivivax sediminis]
MSLTSKSTTAGIIGAVMVTPVLNLLRTGGRGGSRSAWRPPESRQRAFQVNPVAGVYPGSNGPECPADKPDPFPVGVLA